MEMKSALAALTALGHATRLTVFRRLVRAGPSGCMPGDLATELDVPAATLSFHLKELSHAGLIESEPRGRFICYRANFERMTALLGYLTENCCVGDDAPGCAPANACVPVAAKVRRA
jgi:ArsR family transcriptional regulator